MSTRRKQVSTLVLTCALFLQGFANAQTLQPKAPFEEFNYPIKGPDIYQRYCAVCHGPDATGNGPAAPAMKRRVPDLTLLSRNNKGQFPVARVRTILTGNESMASHGSRVMPVWGPIFATIEKNQESANEHLENVIQYLESIQKK